ncbi:MAG: hypothetical protein HKO66_16290 [Saprospiraceae bacterium]|nr:hypothetical protein [Bacteroidia bacterium]NNE13435.1 hypothetical protein [Saprospiraceae bacterium]NNL93804.1 hypothetical protein [Saprospiraceae bacterium]
MSHEFDSDISLKDFILKIQEYFRACLKSWKFIGIIGLLFMLLFGLLTFNQAKEYNAQLTFMINEDEGGSYSGLTSILGQFGLGGSQESNLDKILELSKSRRITQRAIFDTVMIENEEDFLGNHLIKEMKANNEWKGDNGMFSVSEDSLNLKDFLFTHDSIEVFTTKENKALKKVHSILAGDNNQKGIMSCKYNELSGIMTLNVQTKGASLASALANKLFENLSEYYIDKATEKQKYDHDIIKEKYDSINYALANVEYKLANFEDRNRDLFRKKDILQKNRLGAEKQKLQYMSGKAEEQLQLAQLTLENKTPYIQVIDYPLLPLKPINRSLLFYLILGGIIGVFLSTSYVIIKKYYKSIMSSND